tara:strand:- start:473 stop:895 length:423 start_codon:yes stop_codon:yes gene_type:complete
MNSISEATQMLADAFVTVTMVLCMLCSGPHPDGTTILIQWPSMVACEEMARKINRTWHSSVPICLASRQYLEAARFEGQRASDDEIRKNLAMDTCNGLGGMRDYEFANLASCIYTFAGPSYRGRHSAPEGWHGEGLPPRR